VTSLPDIDMYIGLKHRGVTHSLPFAVAFSVVAMLVSLYLFNLNIIDSIMIFSIFLSGFVSHILGDLLTYMKFKVFFPISNKKYGGIGLFKSSDRKVNETILVIGVLLFSVLVYFTYF